MDLSSFPLTKPLANKFRETVSGSKDGAPSWVTEMETGDAGLFGPNSAVWQVHGCISTIVMLESGEGWISAVLKRNFK